MKKYIIAIVIILIVGYFGYKGYLLYKYRSVNNDVVIDTSKIFEKKVEVLNIFSTHIPISSLIDGSYLPGYVKPEDSSFYVLYDENHEVKAYYLASELSQYIYELSYEYEMTVEDKEYVQDNKIKDFLKKNNINNDIELFNYIKYNYPCKSNIFSSKNTIKNNYMINEFVAIALTNFESIDLIGDNYGYIINIKDNLKEIHLLHDDKQYIITLGGTELTSDAFINSLISSIVFDK